MHHFDVFVIRLLPKIDEVYYSLLVIHPVRQYDVKLVHWSLEYVLDSVLACVVGLVFWHCECG